jgi:hypothetical protein
MDIERIIKNIKYVVIDSGNSMCLGKGTVFWIDSVDNVLVVPFYKVAYDYNKTKKILSEIPKVML